MENDYVVLLHGIFRSSRHMRRLAAYLADAGYEVLNLDYPSTSQPLEALAELTWREVQGYTPVPKTVHFVGYSMGCLLLRAMLSQYRPEQMGRVVMLAPPNQGSEVADVLKNNMLYKKLYGPAGQQLITDQSEIALLKGEVDYEVGILAGNLSIDPLSSLFIKGKNDGKVSIERTKLTGMKDHLTVRASHTFFPHSKTVQRQTKHFLQHGEFEK